MSGLGPALADRFGRQMLALIFAAAIIGAAAYATVSYVYNHVSLSVSIETKP
jgi:hypothetical protein